ncbi:MAG: hypothetical protein FWD19_04170, partial [Defluviitaleaceae bacterium]|nr:hypothetical protein [Defluviitaleaceae bacterium]
MQLEGAAPNSEHFTWENALDTGLGTTDAERRRMDVLGMQGQIERQLTALNGIALARVTLSIPNPRPFERDPDVPTAAVALTVTDGFSSNQGRNLAVLVARNVNGLELDNIIILDQFMNTIFSGEDEVHDPTAQAKEMQQ